MKRHFSALIVAVCSLALIAFGMFERTCDSVFDAWHMLKKRLPDIALAVFAGPVQMVQPGDRRRIR